MKFFYSTIIAFYFFVLSVSSTMAAESTWWEIQSIDTMKYSRDTAREKLTDRSFYKVIDTHIDQIAKTGATHVAVGTPYDSEFYPVLKLWVDTARKHNLKVWFRGNLSGWEGWFNYPKIGREEHKKGIQEFILNNKSLFEDGDIFTPCPECENGGPGDPRFTRDVEAYRQFLIDEYDISNDSFDKIGRDVSSGYFSMNGDVANLIMDRETTARVGGVVVVDHYVKTPQKLNEDITRYANQSGGKVILGEFGAPIPDIHGPMSEEAQNQWISEALKLLSENDNLVGVNYWVSYGGSTKLWNDDGSKRASVDTITSYFSPKKIHGVVVNEIDNPINNAVVSYGDKQVLTDRKGEFEIYIVPSVEMVSVNAQTYSPMQFSGSISESEIRIVLEREVEGLFFKIVKFFISVFKN